ncbi:MAG: hypothetical protein GY832_12010 [Chloroflexi bacterium]|nr:hypothetical protein [Chloroflexota bacterium]
MKTKLQKALTAVSSYLAWIVSFALTLFDWMALRSLVRAIVTTVLVTMPTEQRVEKLLFPQLIIPAIDQIATLVFGVIALILVIALEYVYRTAAAKGMLKKRFSLVTALQVGVFVVCLVLILIAGLIPR